MAVDFTTTIGSLTLDNPLILASGPRGGKTGKGMKEFSDAGWGAVVAKTVSINPSKGFPAPTIIDVKPWYMINAQGGPNPGYKRFAEEIKVAKEGRAPVIVSLAGDSAEEFSTMAQEFIASGADAIEINASCPHTPGRARWSRERDVLRDLVREVRNATTAPIWVKLPSTRIVDVPFLAEAVEQGGADAVIPFNTVPAMLIDIETAKPVLGNPNGVGGLSGKAVKPLGLRCVVDTVRVANIPVIGVGGVECGEDVIEYLMAGARAVQVHTLCLREGPQVIDRLLQEMASFMERKGYQSVQELIGLTLQYMPERPFQYLENQ